MKGIECVAGLILDSEWHYSSGRVSFFGRNWGFAHLEAKFSVIESSKSLTILKWVSYL